MILDGREPYIKQTQQELEFIIIMQSKKGQKKQTSKVDFDTEEPILVSYHIVVSFVLQRSLQNIKLYSIY